MQDKAKKYSGAGKDCHQFMNTGQCNRGDDCRFSHGTSLDPNSQPKARVGLSKKKIKKMGGIVESRGTVQMGSWAVKEHERYP